MLSWEDQKRLHEQEYDERLSVGYARNDIAGAAAERRRQRLSGKLPDDPRGFFGRLFRRTNPEHQRAVQRDRTRARQETQEARVDIEQRYRFLGHDVNVAARTGASADERFRNLYGAVANVPTIVNDLEGMPPQAVVDAIERLRRGDPGVTIESVPAAFNVREAVVDLLDVERAEAAGVAAPLPAPSPVAPTSPAASPSSAPTPAGAPGAAPAASPAPGAAPTPTAPPAPAAPRPAWKRAIRATGRGIRATAEFVGDGFVESGKLLKGGAKATGRGIRAAAEFVADDLVGAAEMGADGARAVGRGFRAAAAVGAVGARKIRDGFARLTETTPGGENPFGQGKPWAPFRAWSWLMGLLGGKVDSGEKKK